MADFLDEKRKEIQARLKELKPLVDEYHAARGRRAGARRASQRRRRSERCRRAGAPRRAPHAASPPRQQHRRPPRPSARRRHARRAGAASWCATAPASPSPSSPRRWGSSRTTSTACMPGLAEEGKVDQVRPRLAPARGRCYVVSPCRLHSQSQTRPSLTAVALLLELVDRLVDALAGELGHVEALDDLPLTVGRRHRERGDDPLRARRRSRRTGRPSRPSRRRRCRCTQSYTWSIAALAALTPRSTRRAPR